MCTRGPECKLRGFGPHGCQVPEAGFVCGQTETLEITKEFQRVYAAKMTIIEQDKSPDQLQDKLKLQKEWIDDLTEQNDMLVCAVQELEYEAAQRVLALEEKLKESAKCICEVMKKYREHDVTNDLLSEPLQKIFELEHDQRCLLELIYRARCEGHWTTDGLNFRTLCQEEIFDHTRSRPPPVYDPNKITETLYDREQDLDCKNKELQQFGRCKMELEQKLNHYQSMGNIEVIYDDLRKSKVDYDSLKKQMEDMRQALTEEVASKHDLLLALKRDCQQLEERCLQADKQTAFKDDIIKELRKEIKQLKTQINQDEINALHATIEEISGNLKQALDMQEEKDKAYEQDVRKLNEQICKLRDESAHSTTCTAQTDFDSCQLESLEVIKNKEEIIKIQNDTFSIMRVELQTLKEKEAQMCQERALKQREMDELRRKVCDLETSLQDSQERARNLQMAVDLYLNSINVLEATEEKYKLEIEQQKMTISNLQEALIASKHDLDDLRHKAEDSVSLGWAARWFGSSEPKTPHKPVHDV